MKGGKRPGAGRKPGVTRKQVNLTIRKDQIEPYKKLGGSKWTQSQIDAAIGRQEGGN